MNRNYGKLDDNGTLKRPQRTYEDKGDFILERTDWVVWEKPSTK